MHISYSLVKPFTTNIPEMCDVISTYCLCLTKSIECQKAISLLYHNNGLISNEWKSISAIR